jgi:putative endonuclease
MKKPCVYIITNKSNGTIYTGVTSDLARRIYQHKQKLIEGFSAQYGLDKLVWYQTAATMEAAITEEKRIKGGSREAKLNLIRKMNPQWRDLYKDII